MKVLVDAQLPKRLSDFLRSEGIDSVHTLELPLKNRTPDSEIIEIADRENRVVISKDGDFMDEFIFSSRPRRLLIVSTGNIHNSSLMNIFEKNLVTLIDLFEEARVVEINSDEVVVHY